MKHSEAPAPPRRLVLASANPGKLREFRALLADLPYEVVGMGALGVMPPEETGNTFMANALDKARHAAAASGAAAIADDSGLEVDALGGAPGVRSARYAGEPADDAANNAKLVAAIAGLPLQERRARYRCALVFLAGPADSAPLCVEGVWEGLILDAPRGTGGFGYDAYFYLPDLKLTAAELDLEQKNALSHRGKALRELLSLLKARTPWSAT
jgi:XTP/dITP diphosphohydrolase